MRLDSENAFTGLVLVFINERFDYVFENIVNCNMHCIIIGVCNYVTFRIGCSDKVSQFNRRFTRFNGETVILLIPFSAIIIIIHTIIEFFHGGETIYRQIFCRMIRHIDIRQEEISAGIRLTSETHLF